MKIDVAAVSDTGRVREANEDSFLVDKDLFIFAVADGMGGHVAGEIASATAIESMRAAAARGAGIENAIRTAHAAVKKKSQTQEELSGMGTTLTALGFSSEKNLIIAHVGDSRAYVLHLHDDSPVLERITKDHSLVEELVQAGEITEEEANVHPRRSVITRALGIDGEVDVDTTSITPHRGDRYILCSDGLTSMVRDDDIAQIANAATTPNDCARDLVSRANQEGGADNITVVVLDIINEDISAPSVTHVAQSVAAEENIDRSHYKKGRVSFGARIIIGILAVVALLAGAYATAYHFAHQGYFLDEQNGHVVIMKGHEGGMLFWDAELHSQTGLDVEKLAPSDVLLVERNERFSSRTAAVSRVDQMRKRQVEIPPAPTSSTPTTVVVPAPSTSITISQGTSVSTSGQ